MCTGVKRCSVVLGWCVSLCALAAVYLWLYYHTPAGREHETRLVTIAKGTSLQHIARQLADAGLIRHRRMFVLYVAWFAPGPHLQAGEYALQPSLSPAQIVDIMRSGKMLRHVLTIPEGLTLRDIATLVAAKGLGDRQAILDAAQDAAFIASLQLAVPSLEGYVFPETYYVSRGLSAQELLTLMVRTFHAQYNAPDIAEKARALGLTQHDVVTLASLIEKEARVDAERSLIAAVYHNRLQRGMRLQCDPTVIYALGERFDGNLRKADLDIDSPYNTYRYPGLPPGPIASPGRRSLEAAVAPAAVDYLYFVATGSNGAHHFSHTLEAHNQAVRKYQLRVP